jgi:hypothetical protein
VRLRALAVLRLITNSYLVLCWMVVAIPMRRIVEFLQRDSHWRTPCGHRAAWLILSGACPIGCERFHRRGAAIFAQDTGNGIEEHRFPVASGAVHK